MRISRYAIRALLLALVTVLASRFFGGARSARRLERAPPAPAPVDPREAPRRHEEVPSRPRRPPSAPATSSEWRALRGTEVDGDLAVDPRGRLVLGPEVRRFFEYFLAAEGEASLEEIRSRILAEIQARLEPPAASEAEQLLEVYLAYREGARSLSAPEGGMEVEAALEVLSRLRRAHFGDARAERLFGEEEAEARAALVESQALAESPALAEAPLSPEAQRAAVEAAEHALSDAVRTARAESRAPSASLLEEARRREDGATEEEIHEARVAQFGPEAALRLRALDRRQAEWSARIAELSEALARIAETIPDPNEREAAERALLEARFSPTERLRVRAVLSGRGAAPRSGRRRARRWSRETAERAPIRRRPRRG